MNIRLGFLATGILASMALLACKNDLQIGGGGSGNGGAGGFSGGGPGTGHGEGGYESTATSSGGTGYNSCAPASASTIPGVHIEITSTDCTLSLSNPTLSIQYQVVVDADVPGVRPTPQDAGACGQPGASGLILFEEVKGGDQQYCLCDVGLCEGLPQPVATLAQGIYPATFTWDGHNWGGPSDTANVEGPLFVEGDYAFTVSATGFLATTNGEVPFEIESAIPIHVVP